MDQNILKTLLIYNPWLKNPDIWLDAVAQHLPPALGHPYLKRFADHMSQWPQKKKVNLVVGPRQCGKSTLIWHTLSNMTPNVVYVNANELILREWCTSPALLLEDLKGLIDTPEALFLEEVQYIENSGLFLKGLVDLHPGFSIFATGSSSFHLHDMRRESLAGRAERLQLFPFSLNEWRQAQVSRSSSIVEQFTMEQLLRMLVFGSYPEVCFAEQPESLLNRLVEAFVIRDASDTFRIQYVSKFRKLMTLMAVQIGNLVNFSALASDTGLNVKTVENYSYILQESGIIKLIPPFVGGKRAEIKSAPKLFFVDNGIRNLLVNQFNDFEIRADKGALFENWVFSELLKHASYNDQLYYWRSKAGAEVDFIRQQGADIDCFEAKAGNLKGPTLSRSARSFIEAYQPRTFYIVNLNFRAQDTIEKTHLAWIRPLDLLNLLWTGNQDMDR